MYLRGLVVCHRAGGTGTFHEAVKNFDNGMKGSLMDYRIATLQETKIMDVFRYVARSREEAKPEYEAS